MCQFNTFHSLSTAIHILITEILPRIIQTSPQTLYWSQFQLIMSWGKNKILKIWLLSGKMCYFVSIILKLLQSTDNDRLSRGIRSDVRRQGAVSLAGRAQKANAGGGRKSVCY
jgi:hypothetical protein